MPYTPEDDIDALLREVNAVLDGKDADPQQKAPEPTIRNFANNYGRGAASPAPVIPAYNRDYEAARRRGEQPELLPEQEDEEDVPEYEDEAYDDEEYEDDTLEKTVAAPKAEKQKKKRKGGCLRVLLVMLILFGAFCLGLSFLLKAPRTDAPLGQRKAGAVSILLCGTDKDGTRTDTMMLLYLNPRENAINLVSLPRDTMTRTTSGKLAKLNSAFGRNNGKEDPREGMENLLLYVKDIVGYKPDGYMLIDLDSFVQIVDLMGGVAFDVPQDMYYEDPTQGLTIDLKKGLQTLNGYQAMGLVRFRKGYSNQDLGRVSVQTQFISACMKQWLRVSNVKKFPQILSILEQYTTTDLSTRNLLWIAVNALRAGIGNVQSATLPGKPASRNGASYYILDAQGVADTVNQYCNPYKQTITTQNLNIVK